MSSAHLLSFSRIAAGPVVAILILDHPGDVYLLAALVFAVASLTDAVDGKLARHSQSVSPLGIFLDTTSDKVLVSLTLVAMAIAGLSPGWIPLLILGREFLISGLRSFAASCDLIISAHVWGKGKAAVTMAAIVCLLVSASGRLGGILGPLAPHSVWSQFYTGSVWLLGLAGALTVVSGARYVVDAMPLFRPQRATAKIQREERPRVAAGGDGR
ncbi:MAG: CDP-alcohol phosphatidyltransferase family protein [Chloroflexota bacterium]